MEDQNSGSVSAISLIGVQRAESAFTRSFGMIFRVGKSLRLTGRARVYKDQASVSNDSAGYL